MTKPAIDHAHDNLDARDDGDARLIYKFQMLQKLTLWADAEMCAVPKDASVYEEAAVLNRAVDAVCYRAAKVQMNLICTPPTTDAGREIERRIDTFLADYNFGLILEGRPRGFTELPATSGDFLSTEMIRAAA